MSVNKTFGESMDAKVEALVKNVEYNKSTNHATFDAEAVELPKDITKESLAAHVNFINDLSSQVEVATSAVARNQWEENKELSSVDATLNMGSFTLNSQHHLKQQVGEDFLYGQSTTAVDYVHSEEASDWLNTQRTASQEAAAKLFG